MTATDPPSPFRRRKPGFVQLTRQRVRQVLLLVRKDLVTELRTRDTITTLFFFAFLLVVIFVFSLSAEEEVARQVASGVLWIAIAFSGTLAIDRSFAREQEGHTLTALVLIPGVTPSLFLSKSILNFVYLAAVQLLVVPLTLLMLGISVPEGSLSVFLASLVAGTAGFVMVGTVVSAMLVAIKRRGVLLPIVLYPIVIPLLVMGVEAVSVILENRPDEQALSWVKLMLAADVVYFFGSAWLFGLVVEEE